MRRENYTFLGSTFLVALLSLFCLPAFAQVTQTFTSAAGSTAIPDNAYNGTEASMASKTVTVAGIPAANTLNKIIVKTKIAHTWAGDLTIKLKAPGGQILVLMSRPGLADVGDTGTDCCGSSSELLAANQTTFDDAGTTTSENIGTLGDPIPVATVSPTAGSAPTTYATFALMGSGLGIANLNGTWTLYVGDAGAGDVGTFKEFVLAITSTAPVVADPNACQITCPSNIIVNLAAGACNSIVNYTVPFTPGAACTEFTTFTQPLSVSQNVNTTTVQNGVTIDCGPGANTSSHWRGYAALSDAFTVTSVKAGAEVAGNIQAFVYKYTGAIGGTTLDPALMTLVGQSNVTAFTALQVQNLNMVASTVIPAGSKYVVELRKASPFTAWTVGSNAGGESAPTYLTSAACGITTPTSLASIGLTGSAVLQVVNGTLGIAGTPVPPVVVQTAGLPSGSTFPIGTTTNTFELRGAISGTVYDVCSFDVIVNEFPTPITSLICNDLVTVSLDQSCTLDLNADQILEGGPYHCYDDYLVQLDRSLPLGNGPWVPGILGPGDVHHTYAVRVVDDVNGNGVADPGENTCWGNIAVEDKLAPVFENCGCLPIPVPSFEGSLDPTDPQFSRPLAGSTNGNCFISANSPNFVDVITFGVTTAGVYTFTQVDVGADGFAALYTGNFVDACTNIITTDDDSGGGFSFSISANLTPGTYSLAVTSFAALDAYGAYSIDISGPAQVTAGTTCDFTCGDKAGLLNGSIVAPTPVVTDNCSTPTLIKKDVYVDGGGCGTSVINRTWTATDAWGNSAQCTQVLTLAPLTLADVDFPADITIDCAGCGVTAATSPCITGIPTVPGNDIDGIYEIITYNANCQVVSEGLCNLGAQFDDTRIQVCPGTFKILRHWTILDWCTNTIVEADQLIKVVDDQGPVISVPADMTVSTNPSQCCANVNLPDVIVEDACSSTANVSAMVVVYDQYLTDQVIGTYNINGNSLSTFPGNNFWDCDTLAHYGTTPCLPIGHHQVMYMAEDVCGNTSVETFWLTVVDDIAPVATCTQFTTVAIGTDDPTDCYEPNPDCEFAGVTWVPASAFDQGSHDNCSGIAFTIRRMPESDGTFSDCIDDLAPLCDGYEYNVATTENDSIKFYCCEVGTTQTVILRVYQLDINGNWDYYRNDDGSPLTDPDGVIQYIYNECMINVEVQDKIKPTCQAPANVTINCENFEPTLWAYGYPSSIDNCCLDQTPPTSADAQGQVGIPAGTTAIPGVCGMTQKTYYNNFLNANFDTTCNRGIIIRRFTAWDCQGFSSSCTQRITVTNTQDYNIRFPADVSVNCVTEPNFGKPIITNDEGCELIGISYNDVVFTIVPDACYKIERTWTVINWCTYNPDLPCYAVPRNAVNPVTQLAPFKDWRVWLGNDLNDDNCVTYKQIIKVKDQTPPTVVCQDIDTCDYSTNNVRYWNDGLNWWDNGTMQHDLCEKETEIAVTADDFCDTLSPTGGLRFRYLLFLDLDGDGIMETVVSSADLATRPLGQVLYGNATTPLYHGGTPWFFDNTSNANQRYRFDIDQTANGARIIWRNATSTKLPELAHGRHKIKWIAEDGCGNEAVCEKTFEIRDCKPPVVACANVNINLMVGGMATLWANDFFLYGEDNCTPLPILYQKLAVIRADENPGNAFPTDLPQSIVVTCADQGTLVPVQVWLQDAAGNADFCIAYVDVQANIVGCPNGTSATVAGGLTTGTQGVEQANVELTGTPNINLTQTTGDNGAFNFNAIPLGANVTVTPTKDDNPLNGVTTYDLVLVSKHILGLEPLNTPYKMIAADANRSGSITTFDIVEFRKLILGIYSELPNNTSWRFVNKAYSFPNPSNPFQSAIPENISIPSLSADMMATNFEAVKIGDVNGSAIANSLQSADERTSATMLFDVQDRAVKAGETFTVNFKGTEKVQGYQFTMNFAGLEVMDIAGTGDIKAENFGVFEGALTTSVDGNDNEFAVTFRASKAGMLSNMLGVSSRITKAEAYSLANNRLDVAFRFNGATGSTISGVGFELYQNQPNPFVNKTFIGFHLPEATSATLRIFDETGRMVFSQNGAFAKGYNTISVDRALLNTTGVLYYTLETATDSATKKMIQSK